MSEQQSEPIEAIIPSIDDKSIVDDNQQQQIENAPEREPLAKNRPKELASANESSHKEKNGIYKALAIKLKKELLKTREELYKLKEAYRAEVDRQQEQVDTLSKSLESERVIRTNTTATLEATIRNLRQQLEVAENELQSLQKDFENYKARATKLLQQANPTQSNQNKAFEEERIKQLKSLNDAQNEQLVSLRKQLKEMSAERVELKSEIMSIDGKLKAVYRQVIDLEEKNKLLSSENEGLRSTAEQLGANWNEKSAKIDNLLKQDDTDIDTAKRDRHLDGDDDEPILEDSNTNSNSSVDSSASGYVHIKPTTFEIISRTSVLEDAQNQIDHLTKAYLDSESTNSLLSEQVVALKEEIRRIQRGNDRMELVNNLEYLKNILFKFLSLDSSQIEQRRRLVPVLSTVLKLSPDEANKLNLLATSDKASTSSFFKL